MRQHYAPYNRSEESHRKSTAVYSFHLGRGIFRLRSIRRTIYPLSALRATSPEGGSETTRHSERSEESHRRTDRHILYHFSRGIFRLRSI